MFTKSTFYFLFFLLCSILVKSQNDTTDSFTLIDKAVKKLYQNPDDCIQFSQNVSINTKNDEQKMILQNIMAQAYAMKGDFVQSIKTSLEGDSFLNTENNTAFSQLFMNYSIAEQYQNLDLYRQSENSIDKILAKEINNKNPNNTITIAKLYQLQALNFAVTKKISEAEIAFKKSSQLLKNVNNESQIIKTENELFLASLLIKKNKITEAKLKIETILQNYSGKDFYYLEAFANEKMSRIYFLQKDYEKSLDYLNIALSKIENSNYLPLKSKIYELMSKNYSVLQDSEKYRKYDKLFSETNTKLESNKKDGIRYLIKFIETQENNNLNYFQQAEKSKNLFLIGFCILGIVGLSLYYFNQVKSAKDLQKQLDFVAKLKDIENVKQKSTTTSPIFQNIIITDETEKSDKKTVVISKEKEEDILKKLEELEQSDRFLNKNMSLSILAGQLDTNTKYLTEVINTMKGKNFNAYINELRINHIAYLLKNNPEFLQYKVSYLADFSGFSSHGAFTTIFKSVTGMSPNTYIQQIKKTKNE